MNKLLSANFCRLKKSRILYGVLIAVLFGAAFSILMDCRTAEKIRLEQPDYAPAFDAKLFDLAPMLGLAIALFAAVFLGVEYSDGAMRNKLIAGHTRSAIYLANLTACAAVSLLTAAASLLGRLAGIPTFGPWQGTDGQSLPPLLLIYAGMAVAVAAFFTMICMLSGRRTAAMALCLFGFLAMLMFSSYIYNALCEPELTSEMIITANGIDVSDPFPNPAYIGGKQRAVYEFLLMLFPTGQAIELANQECGPALVLVPLSLAFAAAMTAIGLALFRRKDIK